MPNARWNAVLVLLITGLGFAIRLYNLDAQSVWYDEAFSVAHSARPLNELWPILIKDVVHPPLHYVVLHGWFQLAGVSAVNARFVSVVFGTLSIPLFYLLARRFTNPATSLVAVFLLAISQGAVFYSQEARPYAQAQFLSLLAALAFLSLLRAPSPRTTAYFTVSAIALVYTNYYGAGVLLALGLYWLCFRRDFSPSVFRHLSAAVAILVFAFIPWAVAVKSGGRLSQARFVNNRLHATRRPNLMSPIAALGHLNNSKLESIEAVTSPVPALLGLLLFTLPIAGALIFRRSECPPGLFFGLLYIAIPVTMAILLGAIAVGYHYRYFIFAIPGYHLAVAIGWRICLPNWSARAACLAAAVVFSGFALRANQVPTKTDYRAALRPLAESARAGDCVTGRPRMWKSNLHYGLDVYYRGRPAMRFLSFDSIADAHTTCDRLWIIWDRTWWMNVDRLDGERELESIAALSSNFQPAEHYSHPDVDIQLLVRKKGAQKE